MLNISVVGAGRVGSTLAFMLRRRGHKIVSVISRSLRSARSVGILVGCKKCSTDLSEVAPDSNLIVIATPDNVIQEVSFHLSKLDHLDTERLSVFHTSGALTSDVLGPLAERGSTVFSLHPIQTFSKSISLRQQLKMMEGIWYGCEGESKGVAHARKLVRDLGGNFLAVPKEQKILYHLACVFSSNYPVALLGAVEELSSNLQKGSILPFSRLLSSSMQNALMKGASGALTGPIERGSMEILELHRKELSDRIPALLPLYNALGMYALELARRRGTLTEEQVQQMSMILLSQHDR